MAPCHPAFNCRTASLDGTAAANICRTVGAIRVHHQRSGPRPVPGGTRGLSPALRAEPPGDTAGYPSRYSAEPQQRGARCTVDVHLVNQHGTTVTKGTATGHIQLA